MKSIFYIRSIIVLLCACMTIASFGQIKKGKSLMDESRYSEAIRPLKREFDKNPDLEAGLPLATCYYKTLQYATALDILEKIGETNLSDPADRRFFADVLIANNDFSGAYVSLIRLLSEDQNDPKTNQRLDKVGDLMEWDSLNTRSETTIMKGINTNYNEYAPHLLNSKELLFVSDVNTIQTVYPASYDNRSLHLYYKADIDGNWNEKISKPNMFIKNRDYYYHDGPAAKWEAEDMFAFSLRDIEQGRDAKVGLYFTGLSGDEDALEPFQYNGDFNTGHAAFKDSGKTMVFASDRPGGEGQMDLWYSTYNGKEWAEPKNMGPVINTQSNEVYPTYHDGRLYFSSDRMDKGYGALDIYYADEYYDLGEVHNLRAPINSAYDDFSLTLMEMDRKLSEVDSVIGYYSSNRKLGAGGDDIYTLKFYPEKRVIEEASLKTINDDLPEGTVVKVFNNKSELIYTAQVDKNGEVPLNGLDAYESYRIELDRAAGSDIEMAFIGTDGVQKIINMDKNSNTGSFTAPPKNFGIGKFGEDDMHVNMAFDDNERNNEPISALSKDLDIGGFGMLDRNIKMKFRKTPAIIANIENKETIRESEDGPVEATHEDFVLPIVYFNFDSSTLGSSAKKSIDKLAGYLKKNDGLELEIAGHADSRGANSYNLHLSEKRAESTINYLVAQGIDRKRFSHTGEGESKLVNHCADNVPCTEKEHAVNRRVQFKLYDPNRLARHEEMELMRTISIIRNFRLKSETCQSKDLLTYSSGSKKTAIN